MITRVEIRDTTNDGRIDHHRMMRTGRERKTRIRIAIQKGVDGKRPIVVMTIEL